MSTPLKHSEKDTILFFGKDEVDSISSTLSSVFSSSTIAFSEPPIVEAGPETIMASFEGNHISPSDSNKLYHHSSNENINSFHQESPESHPSISSMNGSSNNDDDHEDDNIPRAIDPITGEINWDCPCLKEAIAPPCGDTFKIAFSCFVKSTTEPKGEDCLDAFIKMQDCYLAHPEIYRHKHDSSHEDLLDTSEGKNDSEKESLLYSESGQDIKQNIAQNLEKDISGHYISESASLSS